MWICPVCKAPLSLSGKQWQCAQNHHYDKAKAGYVNLLLANQKRRPEPGDSNAMMGARRAFLEEGYFQPLASALAELLEQQVYKQTTREPMALYDVGCGEGYYLGRMVALLDARGVAVSGAGNDISRPAIEKAARKYPDLQFAIASNFNLPVAERSQDAVLQIFAPVAESEVFRILASGGYWLRVSPGANHLTQLRAALYQTPQQHVVTETTPTGFNEIHQSSLRFDFQLPDRSSRENLLMMTPYYWSMDQGALDSVIDGMVELSADFSIRILQKTIVEEMPG